MCADHVPAPRIPAVQDKCWFCGAPRPLLEGRVVRPFVLAGVEISPEAKKAARNSHRKGVAAQVEENNAISTIPCSWPGCLNMCSGKSKYCSRECSNRNARARHAQRKVEVVAG